MTLRKQKQPRCQVESPVSSGIPPLGIQGTHKRGCLRYAVVQEMSLLDSNGRPGCSLRQLQVRASRFQVTGSAPPKRPFCCGLLLHFIYGVLQAEDRRRLILLSILSERALVSVPKRVLLVCKDVSSLVVMMPLTCVL